MSLFDIPVRRLVPVVAAAAVAVAVAACGSSSATSTTKSASVPDPSTTTTAATGSRAALVACLKQHGVTLPSRAAGGGAPPGGTNGGAPPGGGFFGGGGAGAGSGRGHFFRNNPKFAAAFKACGGSSRFGLGRGGRGRFTISHAKIDEYVACVRQHGYPQMPNPNFSGKGAVFPASIRTNSKFQSASRACQSILVPARPTGSGGTNTNPSS